MYYADARKSPASTPVRLTQRIWSLAALALLVLGVSCSREARSEGLPANIPFDAEQFKKYWFAGTAEISRYELSQARYGEVHKGDAVLVFVAEEFRTDKQVKLESNERNSAVPILKLNFVKKFLTGIYDYSMMSSVFSPTDFRRFPHPLKVTVSSQEWCGHTYMQMNLRDGDYRVRLHSYFEKEADGDFKVPVALLEDEVWTRIRMSPHLLPVGTISVIPGGFYTRLMHKEVKVMDGVEATLQDYAGTEFKGAGLREYALKYPELNRLLTIVFEGAFPYKIVGWTDTYVSGWGPSAKKLTTTARLTHVLRSPYWEQHGLKDQKLRKQLGL